MLILLGVIKAVWLCRKIFSYLGSNILMYLWVKYNNTKMNFKGWGRKQANLTRSWQLSNLDVQYTIFFTSSMFESFIIKTAISLQKNFEYTCYARTGGRVLSAQACMVLHLPCSPTSRKEAPIEQRIYFNNKSF